MSLLYLNLVWTVSLCPNLDQVPSLPLEKFLNWNCSAFNPDSNWGSESDDAVKYHDGNSEPKGFGEKILSSSPFNHSFNNNAIHQ